jgi:hypothetical protein
MKNQNRRDFLKAAGVFTVASCLPMSFIELVFADQKKTSLSHTSPTLISSISREASSSATGIAGSSGRWRKPTS